VKDEPFGVEFADIALAERRLDAEGVAIGAGPVPYRLDYVLETAPGFVTSRLRVSSRGEGWRRTLDLRRDAAGVWSIAADEEGEADLPSPGGDPTTLAGALDCCHRLSRHRTATLRWARARRQAPPFPTWRTTLFSCVIVVITASPPSLPTPLDLPE
jgi:hypothetical protein